MGSPFSSIGVIGALVAALGLYGLLFMPGCNGYGYAGYGGLPLDALLLVLGRHADVPRRERADRQPQRSRRARWRLGGGQVTEDGSGRAHATADRRPGGLGVRGGAVLDRLRSC